MFYVSQQKRGKVCPKMLYIVTFPKKWFIVSITIVQNSHKAVSPILYFKRYLLVGIIRIMHLYNGHSGVKCLCNVRCSFLDNICLKYLLRIYFPKITLGIL